MKDISLTTKLEKTATLLTLIRLSLRLSHLLPGEGFVVLPRKFLLIDPHHPLESKTSPSWVTSHRRVWAVFSFIGNQM